MRKDQGGEDGLQYADALLDLVNGYLATPLTRADIVWDYAGVRPLYDDKNSNASAVTRDYVFDPVSYTNLTLPTTHAV